MVAWKREVVVRIQNSGWNIHIYTYINSGWNTHIYIYKHTCIWDIMVIYIWDIMVNGQEDLDIDQMIVGKWEGRVSMIHRSLAWTTKHMVIHSLNREYRKSAASVGRWCMNLVLDMLTLRCTLDTKRRYWISSRIYAAQIWLFTGTPKVN